MRSAEPGVLQSSIQQTHSLQEFHKYKGQTIDAVLYFSCLACLLDICVLNAGLEYVLQVQHCSLSTFKYKKCLSFNLE